MKSNDDIPADEMLLAEAIAATHAHGLGWCSGSAFRTKSGLAIHEKPNPDEVSAVCAVGALYFAGRWNAKDFVPPRLKDVCYGNDWSQWVHTPDDNGESLGWAFRCAMTQEEP